MRGLILITIAIVFGVWWWRQNYKPSPLEVHYATLEAKQRVGNLAQMAAYVTQPVAAMLGSGWATTMRISPTNPASLTHNRPGKTQLNLRFIQPTSGSMSPRTITTTIGGK